MDFSCDAQARRGVARSGSVAGWQGGSTHLLSEHLVLRHQHMLGDVDEQLRLLEALEREPLACADLDDGLLGEGGHRRLHHEDRTLHLVLVHPLDVAARGVGSRTSAARVGSARCARAVCVRCKYCFRNHPFGRGHEGRPTLTRTPTRTPHPQAHAQARAQPRPNLRDTTPSLWRSSPLDRLDADLWIRRPEDIDLFGRIVALLHEDSQLLP